jgi:hypothetical protein
MGDAHAPAAAPRLIFGRAVGRGKVGSGIRQSRRSGTSVSRRGETGSSGRPRFAGSLPELVDLFPPVAADGEERDFT